MIKLTDLSLRRGHKLLIEQVNVTVHTGHYVGLTGANGTGKSSIFALIRGQLQTDTGDIFFPKDWIIAHVKQETHALDQMAIDYIMDGDEQFRQLENKIQHALDEQQHDQLAELYGQMESIGGYQANARAGRLMFGLGFQAGDETRSVKTFSGGWRMRLNLAQALMCRSDLLLLDEPTNHLDLEAVIWLEDWLKKYTGTLLLISHDRDFLDNVVNQVMHIEQQGIKVYSGNYSSFEKLRAEQLLLQQAMFEKQQKQIVHMQSFVDRFRYQANKAKQAQSRLKALDKMEQISAAQLDSPFSFSFRPCDNQAHHVVQLLEAHAGYGDKTILFDVELNISRGDRIGLLGHNGAGKSTLIKLLSKQINLQSGEIKTAKNLKIGYFAQHQLEQLDLESSALEMLIGLDKNASEQQLRNFLGGFAFHGDQVDTPVKPFSGGEKARLVLALIVYQKPDLLLLDEPTNHLDLQMRHALSIALQGFEGAMVLVSHDRHLLKTVTDRLVLVSAGRVKSFSGDLDDYRQFVKEQLKQINKQNKTTSEKPKVDTGNLRKQIKPLQNKLQKLEKQLQQLNKEKLTIETQLSNDDIYTENQADKLTELFELQSQNKQKLDQVELSWLECSEQLEGLTA